MQKVYVLLLSIICANNFAMDRNKSRPFCIVAARNLFQAATIDGAITSKNITRRQNTINPLAFSLKAQALAYIALSSSANEELEKAIPEAYFKKLVLLRKAIEDLNIHYIFNPSLAIPLSQDIVLVEALLMCVKDPKQKKLMEFILDNAIKVCALETFKFFYNNGLRLKSNKLGIYLSQICNTDQVPKSNQIAMIQFLLANGADINGSRNNVPLCRAVVMGKIELVEYLLKQGADANGKVGSSSPLEYLFYGHSLICLGGNAIAMVKLLFQYNADTKALCMYNDKKMTYIQRLETIIGETPAISEIALQIIDLIKEHQAKAQKQPSAANQITKEQQFLTAAYTGNTEALKRLIEEKVNVLCVDHKGNTALMLAAQAGRFEAAKFLLEYVQNDVWVNQTNNIGQTAAQLAKSFGDPYLARYIKKQCDKCRDKGCIKRCKQCNNVYYCSWNCKVTERPYHERYCNLAQKGLLDS